MLYELLSPYADRYCVEGIGAAFTGSVHWYLALLADVLGNRSEAAHHEAAAREAHRRVGLVGDPPRLAPAATSPVVESSADADADADAPRAVLIDEGATWAVTYRRCHPAPARQQGVARPGDPARPPTAGGALPRARRRCRCRRRRRPGARRTRPSGIPAAHSGPPRGHRRRPFGERHGTRRTGRGRARRARRAAQPGVRPVRACPGPRLSSRAGADTVTSRVRAAIRQAASVHPDLGRHLQHSVHTGTWCRYAPEHPCDWQIETRR